MTAVLKNENWMPRSPAPKRKPTISTARGVLRTIPTYSDPAARSGGTGLTLHAATTVPITSAAAKDSTVSDTVVRIPLRKRSRLSTTTSTASVPGQPVVVVAAVVVVVAAVLVVVARLVEVPVLG